MPHPSTYCGVCGGKGMWRKTSCCNKTICDDYGSYQPFSYSNTSCARNHDRYTLCASHHNEGHGRGWKKCKKCQDSLGDTMEKYVTQF